MSDELCDILVWKVKTLLDNLGHIADIDRHGYHTLLPLSPGPQLSSERIRASNSYRPVPRNLCHGSQHQAKFPFEGTRRSEPQASRRIGFGLSIFLGGFAIWHLDNEYCSKLIKWRREIGMPWGFVLEGHGWW
jgi:hypothetical protein